MARKVKTDEQRKREANLKKWYKTVFDLYRQSWSQLSNQQIADKLEVDLVEYESYTHAIWFQKMKQKEWKDFYQLHRLDMATSRLLNPVDFSERIRRKTPGISMTDLIYWYCEYRAFYHQD